MAILTRLSMFHDPSFPSIEIQTAEQVALVQDLNRRLLGGQVPMIDQPCLCGGHGDDLVARYDRYRVYQPVVICRSCGLMRCAPRMADAALDWFYSSDFYRQLYDNRSILPHNRDKFLDVVGRRRHRYQALLRLLGDVVPDTVAEIGCGAGWNLYPFHQVGARVTGCDYSPDLTAVGLAMEMDIRTGPRPVLDGERYDLVILCHVLEHMPDPLRELAAVAALMTDNGHLYVEVPDADSFCLGALQSAHLWYFTRAHLAALAARAGLSVVGWQALGPHFGVLLRRTTGGDVHASDCSREYGRLCRIIRHHERRQRIRAVVEKLGLLGLVQSLLQRVRSAPKVP